MSKILYQIENLIEESFFDDVKHSKIWQDFTANVKEVWNSDNLSNAVDNFLEASQRKGSEIASYLGSSEFKSDYRQATIDFTRSVDQAGQYVSNNLKRSWDQYWEVTGNLDRDIGLTKTVVDKSSDMALSVIDASKRQLNVAQDYLLSSKASREGIVWEPSKMDNVINGINKYLDRFKGIPGIDQIQEFSRNYPIVYLTLLAAIPAAIVTSGGLFIYNRTKASRNTIRDLNDAKKKIEKNPKSVIAQKEYAMTAAKHLVLNKKVS